MAFGPLVSPGWLLDHLGQREVVVVDCRFVLGAPGAGRRAWEESHIPTAHFLDVDDDLSGRPSGERGGRHPLPSVEDFAVAAARAGIGFGSAVVAYDEGGEGGAARLWWLLRHFGHSAQAVLDGGLRGWRAMGGRLDNMPPRPWTDGTPFSPRPRSDDVADADELVSRLEDPSLRLLDARAPARFRGDVEPIDAVAGHIPGARNVPFTSVAPDGSFLRPDLLRAALEPAAGGSVVAYCGSGVTASTLVLATAVAGLPVARLYPGSWSEWSARGLPVARGD